MIPKIIHYCWFGGNPKPALIEQYINVWKKILIGYKIVEWNETNFDVNSTIWTKEAMECKKYAFVSDYVRLKVLYEYGGIYMDTDVEVLKTFDELLELPYFIGAENTIHGINTATIGVEPNLKWVKQCLEHYYDRHFVVNGYMDMRVNPGLIRDCLLHNGYNIKNIFSLKEFSLCPTDFCVFPASWFSPLKNKVSYANKSTYAIHRYTASWAEKVSYRKQVINKVKNIVKVILPVFITKYILKGKKERRDKIFKR